MPEISEWLCGCSCGESIGCERKLTVCEVITKEKELESIIELEAENIFICAIVPIIKNVFSESFGSVWENPSDLP